MLERICAFIDLPYQPRMERYHEHAHLRLGEVRTRRREDGSVVITRDERLAMQRLTSAPPVAERVQRWRNEMTPREQRRFAAVAGDVLRDLGYPV